MTKNKPFPFILYRGHLGFHEEWWPIDVQICVGADGHLRFLVRPMNYSITTVRINIIWDEHNEKPPLFKLRLSSMGGNKFESDTVIINSIETHTNRRSKRLKIGLKCQKATMKLDAIRGMEKPFVNFWLRGFESIPPLQTICDLGSVSMAGNYPAPATECVSGYLKVTADQPVVDFAIWRREVEALCSHIKQYMSFAGCRLMKSPVEDVWDGDELERVVIEQINGYRADQAVIHPMMRQDFFERVVDAYFNPPFSINNIRYALEWFAMDAGYTEGRLMNAMTALESLTNSNLDKSEAFFLPQRRFQALSKAMRNAARSYVADEPLPADATDGLLSGEDELMNSLPEKMLDFNRRSLAQKIPALASRWNVPVDDLISDDGFAQAIKARNYIIHRGWYYEPDAGSLEQRDLWSHVLLIREILIRFILTALNYRGEYLSYRGGQKDVTFPPAS